MANGKQLLDGDDHFIPLGTAKEMTKRFREQKENILAPEFRNQDILPICETFNREAFDALLAEDGCAGVRVYFGMKPDLKVRVIVVGVDADNNDILPSERVGTLSSTSKVIVEEGRPCPDFCPHPPL